MQQGDFSIYDPATRVAAANGRFWQTPFAGNRIPVARFDKVGVAIMNFYPKTEKSVGDAFGIGNYRDATTAEKTRYYNLTTHIDQNLGDKHRFFIRYSTYDRQSTHNNYFDNAFVGSQFYFQSYAAAFDHVYTISPSMLLNSRYSYNRFIRGGDQPESAIGFDLASLGFSPEYIKQIPADQVRGEVFAPSEAGAGHFETFDHLFAEMCPDIDSHVSQNECSKLMPSPE